MNLTRNEHNYDRIFRVVLAVILFAGGAAVGGLGFVVGGVLGLIMLVTGTVGFCPIYSVLGVSTASKDA